jgi:hypothetical protein
MPYGLISETDAMTLEKTIDLICDEFKNEFINVTEIGLYNCETAIGIWKYIGQKKVRHCKYIGIDNEKDNKIEPPGFINLIIGNSNEVYNQLEDNSQHLVFVDGCHCFSHVVSDFFCYAPKVKVGGYMVFHDTGKHIKPFKDFQHGDKNNPDAYISVRKALNETGLIIDIDNRHLKVLRKYQMLQWELIFDEADPFNEAGGVIVFKKMY